MNVMTTHSRIFNRIFFYFLAISLFMEIEHDSIGQDLAGTHSVPDESLLALWKRGLTLLNVTSDVGSDIQLQSDILRPAGYVPDRAFLLIRSNTSGVEMAFSSDNELIHYSNHRVIPEIESNDEAIQETLTPSASYMCVPEVELIATAHRLVKALGLDSEFVYAGSTLWTPSQISLQHGDNTTVVDTGRPIAYFKFRRRFMQYVTPTYMQFVDIALLPESGILYSINVAKWEITLPRVSSIDQPTAQKRAENHVKQHIAGSGVRGLPKTVSSNQMLSSPVTRSKTDGSELIKWKESVYVYRFAIFVMSNEVPKEPPATDSELGACTVDVDAETGEVQFFMSLRIRSQDQNEFINRIWW